MLDIKRQKSCYFTILILFFFSFLFTLSRFVIPSVGTNSHLSITVNLNHVPKPLKTLSLISLPSSTMDSSSSSSLSSTLSENVDSEIMEADSIDSVSPTDSLDFSLSSLSSSSTSSSSLSTSDASFASSTTTTTTSSSSSSFPLIETSTSSSASPTSSTVLNKKTTCSFKDRSHQRDLLYFTPNKFSYVYPRFSKARIEFNTSSLLVETFSPLGSSSNPNLPLCKPFQLHGDNWNQQDIFIRLASYSFIAPVENLTLLFDEDEIKWINAHQAQESRLYGENAPDITISNPSFTFATTSNSAENLWRLKSQGFDPSHEGSLLMDCEAPNGDCSLLPTNLSTCNTTTVRWHTPTCRRSELLASIHHNTTERLVKRQELRDCLTKKNLVIVGDSTIRGMWLYILRTINEPVPKNPKFSGSSLTHVSHNNRDIFVFYQYWPIKINGRVILHGEANDKALVEYLMDSVFTLDVGRRKRPVSSSVIDRPTDIALFGIMARPRLVMLARSALCQGYLTAFIRRKTVGIPVNWEFYPTLEELGLDESQYSQWNVTEICHQEGFSLEGDEPVFTRLAPIPTHATVIIKNPGPSFKFIIFFSALQTAPLLRKVVEKFRFKLFESMVPIQSLFPLTNDDACLCHFHYAVKHTKGKKVRDLFGSAANEMWTNLLLEQVCESDRV